MDPNKRLSHGCELCGETQGMVDRMPAVGAGN